MIYFATLSGDKEFKSNLKQIMDSGELGFIDTPSSKQSLADWPERALWCADNGVFNGRFDHDKWLSWLEFHSKDAHRCVFAVAPDVMGDHQATMEKSLPLMPIIRSYGYHAAFVAQNGATVDNMPWDQFDVLFIGGDDEFKLGAEVRLLVAHANRLGKWVHMGRVNSKKRYRYAEAIGCNSVDGSYLRFGPSINLPKLLSWVRSSEPALF